MATSGHRRARDIRASTGSNEVYDLDAKPCGDKGEVVEIQTLPTIEATRCRLLAATEYLGQLDPGTLLSSHLGSEFGGYLLPE